MKMEKVGVNLLKLSWWIPIARIIYKDEHSYQFYHHKKFVQYNLMQTRSTWSRCTSTILCTNWVLIWSKYDIGQRRAAASIISAISGWVKAANDMIVPWGHEWIKFKLIQSITRSIMEGEVWCRRRDVRPVNVQQ